MNDIQKKQRLLLSAQRALLGKVYPSIRAVAIGERRDNELKIICYLDRTVTDDDYENLNDISGEICADIDFLESQEECIFSLQLFSELDNGLTWIYMRKELAN